MKDREWQKGHAAAFITILIWGTTFISTKILLGSFQPIEILFIRFAIGYLALCIIFPRRIHLLDRRQEWYFAAAGLCGVTLYYLLENIALIYTLASVVGVIISIAPFFTLLFGYIFLRDVRPRKQFYFGFAISMVGICLISFQRDADIEFQLQGTILAILAAIIWALYSTITKKISTFGYPTIQVTKHTFFYGLVFMIPTLFFLDFQVSLSQILEKDNMLNLLFLGFGASALCFVTWNYAVRSLGSVKTSVYIYLVPVVTTITSVLILHEKITWSALIGIGFTLAGLFLSESSGIDKEKMIIDKISQVGSGE